MSNCEQSNCLFEESFQNWCKQNNVGNRTVATTIYEKIEPHFSSYDSWKTASADDYYKEREYSKKIDLEDLSEAMREAWDEEFAEYAFDTKEELFKESEKLFNKAYATFSQKWIEQQVEYELEY